MTADDLDHLLAMHAAASPGPWSLRHMDDDLCCCATAVATQPNVSGDHDDLTMSTFHGVVAATYLQHRDYVRPADDRGVENDELIATVRTALPELLRLARIGAAVEQERLAATKT